MLLQLDVHACMAILDVKAAVSALRARCVWTQAICSHWSRTAESACEHSAPHHLETKIRLRSGCDQAVKRLEAGSQRIHQRNYAPNVWNCSHVKDSSLFFSLTPYTQVNPSTLPILKQCLGSTHLATYPDGASSLTRTWGLQAFKWNWPRTLGLTRHDTGLNRQGKTERTTKEKPRRGARPLEKRLRGDDAGARSSDCTARCHGRRHAQAG